MVYQWKMSGMFKVDPQTAGEELERISSGGSLSPENIVSASRLEGAALHNCFDWNDATAAESYRQVQAREIIRNILTVSIDGESTPEPVRAFVNVESDYKPINVVIRSPGYRDEMLRRAHSELRSFQRKYSGLSELAEIFESITRTVKAG